MHMINWVNGVGGRIKPTGPHLEEIGSKHRSIWQPNIIESSDCLIRMTETCTNWSWHL